MPFLRDAYNQLFEVTLTDGTVVPLYDGNHHLFFTVVDSGGTQIVLRDAYEHEFTVGIKPDGDIPMRDAYQHLFYANSDLT